MGEAEKKPMDEQTALLAKTIKSYVKLCTQPQSRSVVLKDTAFLMNLVTLLADDRPKIITYLIRLLLLLTEQEDDLIVLKAVEGLEAAIGAASDKPFSPIILHNLLKISSRFKTIGTRREVQGDAATDNSSAATGGDAALLAAFGNLEGGGTFRRKFVSKNSKQLVFEFEELTESLQYEIESRLLKTRGVISVYFSTVNEMRRAVVRTIIKIQGQDIADILFASGCSTVSQVAKIDGVEEHFTLYESEKKDKTHLPLPEYLDDMLEVTDPNSCIITNEMSQQQKANSGWLSSISSLFW
ncbi:hypothetical protein WR25_22734 [Diploscapter pachys]|uniref:Armadillo repeat-containing protein 1 n=1 Tax=Diploscapter pachys TaxID=2018661 RepID=A0A2A2KUZ6_9BILA|nr:hypothetical protein WR25_22734 [Diploscapter pachys]